MSKRWSLAAPLALAAVAALSVAACSAEAPTDPVGEDPGAELDVVGESNSEEIGRAHV